MKVFYRDFKHNLVKVRAESIDDLWYLSQIIQSKDLVKAKTVRRVKEKSDINRSSGGERKTMTLLLEAEKIDFSGDNILRISGEIAEGPEDLAPAGSHHTLLIEPGTELSVKKEKWSPVEKQRLDEAEKSSLRPKLLIAVIDEGEATIGVVRDSGVNYFEIKRTIGGKYSLEGRDKRKLEFYKETMDLLSNQFSKEEISGLIIAGPGFEKNYFHDFLKENNNQIASKAVLENISSYGKNGVKEVLNRPITKKFSEQLNSARDAGLIEELLTHISRDSGRAAYGYTEIEKAIEIGAVEKLLLSTAYFLAHRSELDAILAKVKNQKGLIHLVNSAEEPGQQLDSLGGTAAILRFKVG
ncbi:mRNA surveillance protein pelota [Candidatus Altiarchaeota archaeon]